MTDAAAVCGAAAHGGAVEGRVGDLKERGATTAVNQVVVTATATPAEVITQKLRINDING